MKIVIAIVGLGIVIFTHSTMASEPAKCGGAIAYRPGGSSVLEARFAFKTELEIFLNDCSVQRALPKSEGNFYIKSFSTEPGIQTLVYSATGFADPQRPTQSTCTMVRTEQYLPTSPGLNGLMPDVQIDISLNCTVPVCTASESPLCRD